MVRKIIVFQIFRSTIHKYYKNIKYHFKNFPLNEKNTFDLLKQTVFPWFWCGFFISAEGSCSTWVEVHQSKRRQWSYTVFPFLLTELKVNFDLFLVTWMLFHNWKRLFSHSLDVGYPFLQTLFALVEWKFIKRKENNEFLAAWIPSIT